MTNKNYTVDEVMQALIKLPEEEKGILTKSLSIDRLTEIGNNAELFQEWLTTSKDQMNWWKIVESGLINLNTELEINKEMKENDIFLGISKELFDKMVSIVTDITHKEYELIEKRIYNMLERLSKIRFFKGDIQMLEFNGIEIKSNVFDMLEVIGEKWRTYSDLERRSIAKAIDSIAFVENVETFNALMENWDKV